MSVMGSPPGAETIIDGKPYLYFAGTGYLGLQGDPRVIEAGCEALRKYGVHTATSRGGFGDNPVTLEVERLAANFFGTEDAFYIATGYAGPTILTDQQVTFDLIAIDEHSHFASLDAARLAIEQSGGTLIRFRHGDADHLRELLKAHAAAEPRVLVMCDGVSPVLGDVSPVRAYLSVINALGAGPGAWAVAGAPGVGLVGDNGRGTIGLEAADLESVLLCATLSKALGGFGGIIPGSAKTIARLKAGSSWYNGASAPPAAAAGATAKALEIVLAEPQLRQKLRGRQHRAAPSDLRQKLHATVAYLKTGLRKLGLDVADTPVPIIPLQIGDAANMRRIADELKQRGLIIAYIASYSGVGPEGCLRIAVFATHTTAMLDRLIDGLRSVI